MKKYQKIYSDIFNKIKSGVLKNGDRLPTEAELSDIYCVSRITCTKAMSELKNDGLVERRARHGTFVKSVSVKDLTVPLILPYNAYINAEIITGAQDTGLKNNCNVPFYNSGNNPETERSLLQKFLKKPPDGILLYPCSTFENLDILTSLYIKRIPVVFIDRNVLGVNYPLVTSDNRQGIFDITALLLKKGYKNPAYYGVHSDMNFAEMERFEGFCAALTASKIPVIQGNIIQIPQSISKDFKYARELSKELFAAAENVLDRFMSSATEKSAIVCTNDYLAYSLTVARKKYGQFTASLPIITGFDNISHAQNHGITTVAQDFYALGKEALTTILAPLPAEPHTISKKIPTKLILRNL